MLVQFVLARRCVRIEVHATHYLVLRTQSRGASSRSWIRKEPGSKASRRERSFST